MKDIALIGNPNVGKTTFFNALTNGIEHTGNWHGKTVEIAKSECIVNEKVYTVADLPGIYSLSDSTMEERVTIDYLRNIDQTVFLFLDGTNIKKGLFLYFELKKYNKEIVLFITMKDILSKQNMYIDLGKFEEIIGSQVFLIDASEKIDFDKIFSKIENDSPTREVRTVYIEYESDKKYEYIHNICEEISDEILNKEFEEGKKIKIIDNILLNKYIGLPITCFCCIALFSLSIALCGVIHQFLFYNFSNVIDYINTGLYEMEKFAFLRTILIDGGLSASLFVLSVMVPTMVIFFPFFSLIEEIGIIPRIVFNIDGLFSKFNLSGKNAIPMMLSLGCNCVGVTSTRIFENENKRKIAILTNNFVPCSGRLPMIFMLVLTYLTDNIFNAVAIVLFFILFSIGIMFVISCIYGRIYKVEEKLIVYELPILKKPNLVTVLKRSILEKALPVLCVSIYYSLIAGVSIAILKNVVIADTSLLVMFSDFLDPLGKIMGLSGVILLAFIIGSAANEIVVPVVLLIYSGESIFFQNMNFSQFGLGLGTVICMIVFTLVHFPCFATLATIKKETQSTCFTIMCALVPTFVGVIICIIINIILQNLQIAQFV